MEEIFRNLEWKDKGLTINGKLINNFRFADDITLISESLRELTEMIQELNKKGKKVGLTINFGKSKIITTSPNPPKIKVEKKKK